MKRFTLIALLALFASVFVVLAASTPSEAAVGDYLNGLVYIDANGNGVWDVGEEGYAGEDYCELENEAWICRYHGATITFTPTWGNPDDDGYTLESTGWMEPDEDGNEACSHQDMNDALENHTKEMRPCAGTFGFIVWGADESWWNVTVTVPDGYEATSPTTVMHGCKCKDTIDFGIMPID